MAIIEFFDANRISLGRIQVHGMFQSIGEIFPANETKKKKQQEKHEFCGQTLTN